jgi:hypothetical protein
LSSALHAVISMESMVILRATAWHSPDNEPLLQVEECSGSNDAISQIYERLGRKITQGKIGARKKHGLTFFRIDLNGSLVGSMWLVHGGCRYVDEVGLEIVAPPPTVWLRDVWIDRACRGQRIFKRSLAKILGTHFPDVDTLWSDTTEGNLSSRRGHMAAGFEEVGVIRCVRVNPLLIFRSTQLPSPLTAVDFLAERRMVFQLPAFHRFDRQMRA